MIATAEKEKEAARRVLPSSRLGGLAASARLPQRKELDHFTITVNKSWAVWPRSSVTVPVRFIVRHMNSFQ